MLKEFFRNKFMILLVGLGSLVILVGMTFVGMSLGSDSCIPKEDSGIQSMMTTNAIGFSACPASEHFIFGG